jgi:hypothetical protein
VYLDTGTSIIGTNMYAYCGNDCVNMGDPDGTDAIYVLCYGGDAGGIPVVGHSLLLLQDANGKWWGTEYTGSKPSNARVQTFEMTEYDWKRVKIPVNKTLTKGASTALIKGDFTKSLKLAQTYKKLDDDREKNGQSLKTSRFGGGVGYWVLGNNCLHYVLIIMNAATGIPKPVMDYLARTNLSTTIPSVFYAELLAALRLSGVKKPK